MATTTTTTKKNQIQMSVENKTGEENWTGNAVNKKKKRNKKTTLKISTIRGFPKSRVRVHHLLYIFLISFIPFYFGLGR